MTFHVEERVTIMKKKLVPILGISFALLLLASGCTNKKESRSDDAQKAVTTEKKDDTAQSSSDKGEQDTVSAQQGKSEEDYQRKEGVNGPLPAVNYTYDAIVDAAGGICRFPSVYEEHYQENVKTWNRQVKEEVKKIAPKLTEEASDKEIQHLFQQFLYIAGYDYPVFEPIERYSYVVFKKDMEDPFTHKKNYRRRQCSSRNRPGLLWLHGADHKWKNHDGDCEAVHWRRAFQNAGKGKSGASRFRP